MSQLINLTGRKFGYLTVIDRNTAIRRKNRQSYWLCLCDCGNTITVSSSNLLQGHTKSCGCLKKEKITKHGMVNTPEYQAYQGMMDRCYNINSKEYDCYGGRGINVCDRWRGNFPAFFQDMGKRPYNSYSSDRINVNGNYEPQNCRWTDIYTQAQNRTLRRDNNTGITGVSKVGNRYRVKITAFGKVHHIGYFPTIEEAKLARKKAESLYWKD